MMRIKQNSQRSNELTANANYMSINETSKIKRLII